MYNSRCVIRISSPLIPSVTPPLCWSTRAGRAAPAKRSPFGFTLSGIRLYQFFLSVSLHFFYYVCSGNTKHKSSTISTQNRFAKANFIIQNNQNCLAVFIQVEGLFYIEFTQKWQLGRRTVGRVVSHTTRPSVVRTPHVAPPFSAPTVSATPCGAALQLTVATPSHFVYRSAVRCLTLHARSAQLVVHPTTRRLLPSLVWPQRRALSNRSVQDLTRRSPSTHPLGGCICCPSRKPCCCGALKQLALG